MKSLLQFNFFHNQYKFLWAPLSTVGFDHKMKTEKNNIAFLI